MIRKPRVYQTIVVRLSLDHGRVTFDKCGLHVIPGDTIEWRFNGPNAFAIIIKNFRSPLTLGSAVAAGPVRKIRLKVRNDADYGCYAYTICVADGAHLRLSDPEIIVRPPDGRG